MIERPRLEKESAAVTEVRGRSLRSDVVVPGLAAALLIPLYLALALRNHALMKTCGYDLGIFVQEVKAYSQLHAPMVPLLGGGSSLGDHFSPAVAVLAPLYRVFPSPQTLLVAQAVLFALGVVPLARWAVRSLGVGAGIVAAIGYGLSWGLAAALNYDFHEIALAVPLIAFSVTALGQRRWRAAMLWALPLVFVKEDMGLTVIVIGLLVAWWTDGRTRMHGLLTAAWGAGWTVLAVKVIVPWISSTGAYAQGSKLPTGGLPSAMSSALHGVLGADARGTTFFMLLLISGFAAMRSPLALVAIPTLAWRFISDNSNFWGPIFHYSAILMPVMFAALIDALVRGRESGGVPRWTRRLILATVLAVAVLLVPAHAFAKLTRAETWRPAPQLAAVQDFAARIPDGDSVAASNNLIPRLVSDHEVTVFPRLKTDSTTPDWIMVDTSHPPNWPKDAAGDRSALADAKQAGYVERGNRDGIELLQRMAR